MAGIGRIGPAASSRVAMELYRQRVDQRVGDDHAARAAQAQNVRQASNVQATSYAQASQAAASLAPAQSRYTGPAQHAPPAPPPHRAEPTSRDRDVLDDRMAAASIAAFQDLRATQQRPPVTRGGGTLKQDADLPKPTAQDPPSISTTGLLTFLTDFR